MKYCGVREQQLFPQVVKRIHALTNQGGLFVTEDKTIYEFDTDGIILPLANRQEFATELFQQALQPPPLARPWDSRGLAVSDDHSALFIADCKWSAEGNILDACLINLVGHELPTSRRIMGVPATRTDHDPFFFLNRNRVGIIMYDGLCVNMDARDLSPYPTFNFITREFSPPVVCLHPHPGGRDFSFGMGEPGWGVYRRVKLEDNREKITVKVVDEAVFKGRADLWATVPSPSGIYAFVFLMNHETGMVLPGGPDAHPIQDLGEVIRISAGRTEKLSVQGELAIDFGVVEAQLLKPYPLPAEAYRFYPKAPNFEGLNAILCPVTDDVVLYPTPGGTLIEVDFHLGTTRELARLGFPIQAMKLLSPAGPLAVAGGEGQFWLLDVEQ